MVQLQPAHGRKVISFGIEEQVSEKSNRALQGRGITGTQSPVNLDKRLIGGADLVYQYGVTERRGHMQVVDEEHFDGVDSPGLISASLAGVISSLHSTKHFARRRVNDVVTGKFPDHFIDSDRDEIDAMLGHFPDGGLGEFSVRLDDHLTGSRVGDVDGGLLVGQKLRIGDLDNACRLRR